jgi:hypothetical protein
LIFWNPVNMSYQTHSASFHKFLYLWNMQSYNNSISFVVQNPLEINDIKFLSMVQYHKVTLLWKSDYIRNVNKMDITTNFSLSRYLFMTL